MTELTAEAIRTVGPADALPDGFVAFYLSDRKLRISVARADGSIRNRA
jgi:isocitrate dehydrogenase kinase/phosphatase